MTTVNKSLSPEQEAVNARYYASLRRARGVAETSEPNVSTNVSRATGSERDILIRTVIGEAANEGQLGWAAVAHVIRNRTADTRWPGTAREVSLQNKQFSAWNSGAGGNELVNKYKPGDKTYEAVGKVVDGVFSGGIPDPTGGATHYYSPAGMKALVNQGAQSNLVPKWWDKEVAAAGGNFVTIGGHRFAGKANRIPSNNGAKGVNPLENYTQSKPGELGFSQFKKDKSNFIVKPASDWTPEEIELFNTKGIMPEIEVNQDHADLRFSEATLENPVQVDNNANSLFNGFAGAADAEVTLPNGRQVTARIRGSSSSFIYDAHREIQAKVAREL